MARSVRMVLLLVSLLVVLTAGGILLVWWLVDGDQAGERLEALLSDALDMDIDIGSSPRFGLMGGASVTFSDIQLAREGEVMIRADRLRSRLDLTSLLTGDLQLTELQLQKPELEIERISPGRFNLSPPEDEREDLDEFSLRRAEVSAMRLRYVDRLSGLEWLFEECRLDLRDVAHAGGKARQALETLVGEGDLHCERLSHGEFVVAALSADLMADQGIVELGPFSASMFDGEATGLLKLDLTSSPPVYSLDGQISQFDLATFLAILEPEPSVTGQLDLEMDLHARGRTWQDVRKGASGSIQLSSGALLLEGHDLDEELDDYSATQRFNLVDVGAVFLAGPVGLVASRGYTFTGLIEGDEGSTRIDRMISKWSIEDGTAWASDVAFATEENRLALSGGLDFGEYRFEDLKVAVVDGDGCPVIEQRITGPFQEPDVEQPNFLVTVAGPFLDLLERGVQAITGEDCDVFYEGSIAHP